MSYPVLGAFERATGGYEGFCWSPERPADRLVVEIRDDDRLVMSVVASRFSSEHRDQHLGDGRVGFRIIDAMLPALHGVVEARERDSGQLLGRHVLSESLAEADLSRVEAELAELDDRIAGLKIATSKTSPRSYHPSLEVARAGGNPARLITGASLVTERVPPFPHEDISIVLTASPDPEATISTLINLGIGTSSPDVEVILIDPHPHSQLSRLATSLDGCVYLPAPEDCDESRNRNHAAAMATRPFLAFATARQQMDLADLHDPIWFDRDLALGGAAAMLYRRSDMAMPRGAAPAIVLDFDLFVDRVCFTSVGGFNNHLPDLSGFAEIDLLTRVIALKRRSTEALID